MGGKLIPRGGGVVAHAAFIIGRCYCCSDPLPEPPDVGHLDVGHQLGLRGEHLFALEAAVRPGLPVDAGGVLGQVAPPEGRVVTLVASGRITN